MQEMLLEKLREAIKDVPCNSLSRVYPYQLQEWTDVMSGEEFEEVVQEFLYLILDYSHNHYTFKHLRV